MLACWLQFELKGIPLPLERTSIFVVPLATVAVGAAVSALPFNRVAAHRSMARAVRALGIAILSLASFYFAGELRDSYFRLWKEGADVRAAFSVILDLCRRSGVREVASDPNLTSSLNFYRVAYKANDIDEFPYSEAMPANKFVYVVLESRYGNVMSKEGLRAAWRGQVSDLVVLVRPEVPGIGKP